MRKIPISEGRTHAAIMTELRLVYAASHLLQGLVETYPADLDTEHVQQVIMDLAALAARLTKEQREVGLDE